MPIGIRALPDGGLLFQDRERNVLVYRRGRQGTLFEIPYTVASQQHMLQPAVRVVGELGQELSPEQVQEVLNEILAHLKDLSVVAWRGPGLRE